MRCEESSAPLLHSIAVSSVFAQKLHPARRRIARRRFRVTTGALVTAAVLTIGAGNAWGHAAFLESQPEAGTRVEAGPGQITLTFTEPLNERLSEATLVNVETGEEVPAPLVTVEESELVLQPKARLERAPYRVDWHTVSTVDGHALEGSFSFGVQTAPASVAHSLEQSPMARDGWLRIGARAVFYTAILFFAGGLFTAALLSRRRPAAWLLPEGVAGSLQALGASPTALTERAWRRTRDAGWVAASAAATMAILEAGDAGGSRGLGGLGDFLLTNEAGLARVAALVAVLVAVVLARRLPVAASSWLALGFLAIALGGHANSADPRWLAVATDWIHLLAAGVWVGGIAQIALTWLPLVRRGDPALQREAARSVLPRFGRLALPAFLVVAATGSTNAIIQLGRPAALWETAYGRVLAVKIALVGLIALASYLHAFRLRPRLAAANPPPEAVSERRHWRLLFSEPLLAGGTIAAVAVLVAFPLPPQQLGEADEAEAAAPCEGCPLPRARDDQFVVAEQAGSQIAAFWLRRDAAGLSGTLRLLDKDAEPTEAPVRLAGGALEACGEGCWRFAVPEPVRTLTAIVEEDGEEYEATVPARWVQGSEADARRLLREAQEAMRALRTVRLDETVSSGPGAQVETRYRFRGPDRMAYRASSGGRAVAIGKRRYSRGADERWERGRFGAGGGFRLDEFFRWSVYASSVRMLTPVKAGEPVVLALFDPATPVWYRLRIDVQSTRVVGEHLIAAGHFMNRRYHAFDRPVAIAAPPTG